jgi:cytochrome c556
MLRAAFALTAVVIIATAAIAQSDLLADRKALMKKTGENAAALNKMVKGEAPFDGALVTAAYTQWTDLAQKLPTLFPEPPKPGQETRALPKIWEAKADFDEKIAAFTKAVNDNKGKAATLDELKVAYPATAKTCGNCHETYRRPQQQH